MQQRELTTTELYIMKIIEQSPEPIKVLTVHLDGVLKFFELYRDHKGIIFSGPMTSSGREIGIVDPGPSLMENLLKNR